MINGNPYNTGTPKYRSAQDIYDALSELVQSEEMGILSEMFSDVSYDGQNYYYTDKGYKLREHFDKLSDYGNNMWLMDLAVYQLNSSEDGSVNSYEIHDMVYQALCDDALAKRIGFKKLFIEKMLDNDKSSYEEISEAYREELGELNRFSSWDNIQAFNRVMSARGAESSVVTPYPPFCHCLHEKIMRLELGNETRLIAECRSLLTSYDDFMLGLRMNQALYQSLEQRYQSKFAALQEAYNEKVRQLYVLAESQGIALPEMPKSLTSGEAVTA